MGIYTPGTIEGLTAGMLQRVCARAVADHTPNTNCDCRETLTVILPNSDPRNADGHTDWCASVVPRDPLAPLLTPSTVTINEIRTVEGDKDFDRCSFARWANEEFQYNGWQYIIRDYHGTSGMPWRIAPANPENVTIGDAAVNISERMLASLLTAQNGPHPDPYIALVEVTYDTAGHRAGYGVRRSGACSCFYD